MLKRIFTQHKYAPVFLLAAIAILISVCTRLFFMTSMWNELQISASQIWGVFFIGLLYDIIVSSFIIIPFILQITFTNNFIYTNKGRIITAAFFIGLLSLLFFTNIFPADFNGDLYKAVIYYIIFRFLAFAFLYTMGQSFRYKWRSAVLKIFSFIVIFLLLFNAVSEYFFWKEFGARYNFIAVDYLVYTNEVIGNIKESYPISTILSIIFLLATILYVLARKAITKSVYIPFRFIKRCILALSLLIIPAIGVFIVNPQWKNFSKNNYANELAGNGIYDFVQAYKSNELDFYKYYATLPDSTAFNIMRTQLSTPNAVFTSNDLFNLERQITYPEAEKKMNVIMISVESLSGSFMKAFGNKDNITPQLDSLANEGIFFTNLYASGTRTVRGLEALSLGIPPSPGQSIVKRPDNGGLFSLGAVFKSKGYITQFIYGGYGYFDNMNTFFSNNDYDVIDRTAIAAKDIHYANIWGVADEDLFTLALNTMDDNYKKGKPFFSQVMTVSNHRPYTYPDGRIDIPPSTQSRDGAVKYTDFAIGDFIKRAASKPWFNNTMFVIVADHCAASSGSAALPVTGYHIPMIIYSPKNILPKKEERLVSQIDIAPTILGMLNFNYKSKFFGQDISHASAENQKAFISTYQGLGFITNGQLIVQSPLKKIKSYQPDFITGNATDITNTDSLVQKAIAYYQTASWLIKNKKYDSKSLFSDR
ncbi:LTA synthase family protein [Ferruginibacter lapsinanis]|uniref:LTA synthase family protein n=1 Tax=Ferruginibacter lapsinanis TaxID=563172 RepID=UPI001E47C579|nr:LTA synthase family protein [Ferruginibacter lapsinanis]UEG48704.1 LTA synthase family protein [Ferruginibacter lapsinanis]